jgi:hypothetical protein
MTVYVGRYGRGPAPGAPGFGDGHTCWPSFSILADCRDLNYPAASTRTPLMPRPAARTSYSVSVPAFTSMTQ